MNSFSALADGASSSGKRKNRNKNKKKKAAAAAAAAAAGSGDLTSAKAPEVAVAAAEAAAAAAAKENEAVVDYVVAVGFDRADVDLAIDEMFATGLAYQSSKAIVKYLKQKALKALEARKDADAAAATATAAAAKSVHSPVIQQNGMTRSEATVASAPVAPTGSFAATLEQAASLPNLESVLDGLIVLLDDKTARPSEIFSSQATNLLFNNLFRECPKDRTIDQRLHKFLLKLFEALCPEQVRTPSGNMNTGIAAGAIRRVMDSLAVLRDAESRLEQSSYEADSSSNNAQVRLTCEKASSLVADTLKSIFRAKEAAEFKQKNGGRADIKSNAVSDSAPMDLPSRVGAMEAEILGGFHDGFTPQINRNGPLSPGDVSRLFRLRDSTEQIVETCISGQQAWTTRPSQQQQQQRVVASSSVSSLANGANGVHGAVQTMLASTVQNTKNLNSRQQMLLQHMQALTTASSSSSGGSDGLVQLEVRLMTDRQQLMARKEELIREVHVIDTQLEGVDVQLKDIEQQKSAVNSNKEAKVNNLRVDMEKVSALGQVFNAQRAALESLNEFVVSTKKAVTGEPVAAPTKQVTDRLGAPASASSSSNDQHSHARWACRTLQAGARYLGVESECVKLMRQRVEQGQANAIAKAARLQEARTFGIPSLVVEAQTQLDTLENETREDQQTMSVLQQKGQEVGRNLARLASSLPADLLKSQTPAVTAIIACLSELGLPDVGAGVMRLLPNVNVNTNVASPAPPGFVAPEQQQQQRASVPVSSPLPGQVSSVPVKAHVAAIPVVSIPAVAAAAPVVAAAAAPAVVKDAPPVAPKRMWGAPAAVSAPARSLKEIQEDELRQRQQAAADKIQAKKDKEDAKVKAAQAKLDAIAKKEADAIAAKEAEKAVIAAEIAQKEADVVAAKVLAAKVAKEEADAVAAKIAQQEVEAAKLAQDDIDAVAAKAAQEEADAVAAKVLADKVAREEANAAAAKVAQEEAAVAAKVAQEKAGAVAAKELASKIAQQEADAAAATALAAKVAQEEADALAAKVLAEKVVQEKADVAAAKVLAAKVEQEEADSAAAAKLLVEAAAQEEADAAAAKLLAAKVAQEENAAAAADALAAKVAQEKAATVAAKLLAEKVAQEKAAAAAVAKAAADRKAAVEQKKAQEERASAAGAAEEPTENEATVAANALECALQAVVDTKKAADAAMQTTSAANAALAAASTPEAKVEAQDAVKNAKANFMKTLMANKQAKKNAETATQLVESMQPQA